MSIFTEGTFNDPITQDDLEPTAPERIRATVMETYTSLLGPSAYRWGELDEARKWGGMAFQEYDKAGAQQWIDGHGLTGHLHVEDRNYNQLELSILARRKQAELRRQYVLERADGGVARGAERLLLSLVTSLADPPTIATGLVPVVGEAKYASLLQRAGSSVLRRAAVRAGVGAVEGTVGQALVEPIVYGAHQAEQADYTLYDSLANIAFGGVFGGGLHAVGGGVIDYRTGQREARLTAAGDALRARLDELAKAEGTGPVADPLRAPETLQTVSSTLYALHAGRRAQLVEQASSVLPENVRVDTEARLREARDRLKAADESLGGDVTGLRETISEAEQLLRGHELGAAAVADLNRLDRAWDGADLTQRAELLGANMRSQLFEAQTLDAAGALGGRVEELDAKLADLRQQLEARRTDADPLPDQVDPVGAGPFDTLKAEVKTRDLRALEDRIAATQAERDAVGGLADRWRADTMRSAQGRAAAAAPETRESALRAVVAQDLAGDPVNVEPLFEFDPATRTRPVEETLDSLRRPPQEPQPEPVPAVDAAELSAVEQQIADLDEMVRDLEADLKASGVELPEDLRADLEAAREIKEQAGLAAETARMLAACAMRKAV